MTKTVLLFAVFCIAIAKVKGDGHIAAMRNSVCPGIAELYSASFSEPCKGKFANVLSTGEEITPQEYCQCILTLPQETVTHLLCKPFENFQGTLLESYNHCSASSSSSTACWGDDNAVLSEETEGAMTSCAETPQYCTDDKVLTDAGAPAGWFKTTCCATCATGTPAAGVPDPNQDGDDHQHGDDSSPASVDTATTCRQLKNAYKASECCNADKDKLLTKPVSVNAISVLVEKLRPTKDYNIKTCWDNCGEEWSSCDSKYCDPLWETHFNSAQDDTDFDTRIMENQEASHSKLVASREAMNKMTTPEINDQNMVCRGLMKLQELDNEAADQVLRDNCTNHATESECNAIKLSTTNDGSNACSWMFNACVPSLT